MNDKALYDLLAKAQLHPKSLTPLERLIWWIHDTRNEGGLNNDILIPAAAELEQYQQAAEQLRNTVWLGEPVPAPVVDMFAPEFVEVITGTCSCTPCRECKGTGSAFISFDSHGQYIGSRRLDDMDEITTCENCSGSGIETICDYCRELEAIAEAE